VRPPALFPADGTRCPCLCRRCDSLEFPPATGMVVNAEGRAHRAVAAFPADLRPIRFARRRSRCRCTGLEWPPGRNGCSGRSPQELWRSTLGLHAQRGATRRTCCRLTVDPELDRVLRLTNRRPRLPAGRDTIPSPRQASRFAGTWGAAPFPDSESVCRSSVTERRPARAGRNRELSQSWWGV
jgi:hypothetical protein